jgi:SAM-dependent methyltransferase
VIKRLLESPIVYELSQVLWYRPGRQHEYIARYAQPRGGERVLDIGCGTGSLSQYFPDAVYHGFDSNVAYIRHARKKYGRAEFRHGIVGRDVPVERHSYDLVMANGVLHHLDDGEVLALLTLAYEALKPNGRLISRDGCFEPGQGRVARMLLKNDRGRFVRTEEGYRTLVEQVFNRTCVTIRRDMLRLPYSLIIFQCLKGRP